MNLLASHPRVAVVGAGMAGATCAAGLRAAGLPVTLFDKSRGLGGRMATRRTALGDAELAFDHGAAFIDARQPRFRALLARAEAAGAVRRWRPHVHAAFPAAGGAREVFVPVGEMPALVRHLAGDLPRELEFAVQRLERRAGGWALHAADGRLAEGFDQVVLAMPPVQAAALLAPHHERWAAALGAAPMQPCWTLMAAGPDADWPWDACEPGDGVLAFAARCERKPGRAAPAGRALWVAHATAEWSEAHLEATPEAVTRELSRALARLLPGGVAPKWPHRAVHRWRYAAPRPGALVVAGDGADTGGDCWWDARRGLGVCGDFLGAASVGLASPLAGVEAAWRSGDELADTMLAALDALDAPFEITPVAVERREPRAAPRREPLAA